MAKSQQSFAKNEKEKKRRKKRQDKMERREQRKLEKAENKGASLKEMFAYVDENGNLTTTPPDPTKKKKVIKAEDIVLGIPKKDHVPEEKTRTGRVKYFNAEKGYGFIIDSMTKDSIFVHINNVSGDDINEGSNVTFEVEMGPKGANAVMVKVV